MAKYYYAVKKGKNIGIYESWKECEENVRGFSGAIYKKFSSPEEALRFMEGGEEQGEEKDRLELKEGEAIAYVDGSFSLEKFEYSYGIVFLTVAGKETFSGKEDHRDLAEMRNVSGELKGAMEAMKIALDRNIVTLYLHYDYTGIENWALGNWKTNKEGTKNYKEFYDSIKGKLKVKFIKVKAHSGVKYNEEADKLAKEAIT
ncbi:MAG: ribonuclease H family protein [Tissierellaceae bacterium]